MANGLELRAPFLDKDFAEFCISLPNQFKITPVQEKVLLREACRQLWTDDIRRRKKQGFAATVSKWLELPAVAALKEKYLGNKGNKIFSVLNYEVVKKYATVNNNKTWALLNLSMWMENYQFSILTK
jgi:asparagine synthase (glutamine-hydrolysing)